MAKLPQLIIDIFEHANIPLAELTSSGSRSGGTKVTRSSTGEKYFTKTQSDIKQMRGEVEGLQAMGMTAPGLVPRLIGFEVSQDKREGGMVSQFFDLSSARGGSAQKELARRLAEMHRPPPQDSEGYEGKYGFAVATHCGVTEQDNTWEASWEAFFRDRRLGDMVTRIRDKEISKAWEELKSNAVPALLHAFDPPPQPVILHGDLWSGNVGFDALTQTPVIFDPASYYGHNEADLGITHMFGGFSNEFYEEYHSIHPRSEPHYSQRQKLYELYHHLNHTLMFGGSYKSGALGIMRSLISWADGLE